jgi:hypothetical protein
MTYQKLAPRTLSPELVEVYKTNPEKDSLQKHGLITIRPELLLPDRHDPPCLCSLDQR